MKITISEAAQAAQLNAGTNRATGPRSNASDGSRINLFDRTDWLVFAAGTLAVFLAYLFTLAPNVTLEDSGELAVGSMYAGVPHPPGYPVWTLYTWTFTKLIPFGNIAWRVAFASAVAGAFACGLIALVVCRGSRQLQASLSATPVTTASKALGPVAGLAAALLMGFNGYMWSQSVIVEVYSLSVLSLMGVVCLLMCWVYAPERRRYLYWASFLFGVCLTNHMSLLVAAIGLQVAVILIDRKLGRDLFLINALVYLGILLGADSTSSLKRGGLAFLFHLVGGGSLLTVAWLMVKTGKLLSEWKALLLSGLAFVFGAAFYLYMPLASSTNPPMNWGYARTADGFMHALKREQYSGIDPVNVGRVLKSFLSPWNAESRTSVSHFAGQLALYGNGAADEFSPLLLIVGLFPLLAWKKLQSRERMWMIGLAAIWLCLSLIMLLLLNPGLDRQSVDLHRVFFTASHVIIAIFIGYGLTLLALWLGGEGSRSGRRWIPGVVAISLSFWHLAHVLDQRFVDLSFGAALGRVFQHGENVIPASGALLFVVIALVFAGFVLWGKRRTSFLLALFLCLPLPSALLHWQDNEQRGHLFGYWFGHDMFTPPFKTADGHPIYPEMARDAVLFGGTDPGRFNPTYMIFCESFTPASEKEDPNFDRRDVAIITQNALADPTYLNYIRAHYNRGAQQDPPFFQEFFNKPVLKTLMPAWRVADSALMTIGRNIERERRVAGLYPAQSVYTPSTADHNVAFEAYTRDAARRMQLGQLKPGEEVRMVGDRVQIAGHTAVMSINGALTKVIFDQNPTREFYVEESFPLDWMFPHLTPFGIIMKINRQPVTVLTDEVLQRDHQFWTQYSDRLIGNWIDYDTPIQSICDFAERLYLRHNYGGFNGDRKFIRDDNAQKAFSKLRSSIAGTYLWRLGYLGIDCPAEFSARKDRKEHERILKEAEFALKQAFAFCPYSPEAVFRLVQFLSNQSRDDEAIRVVRTCLKFDPENGSMQNLLEQLVSIKANRNAPPQARSGTPGIDAAQVQALLANGQTSQVFAALDHAVSNSTSGLQEVLLAAKTFAELQDPNRLQAALSRLTQLVPDNPEALYDLAGVQVINHRTNEAKNSLRTALDLSAARQKRDSRARDLLEAARKDPRFTGMVD